MEINNIAAISNQLSDVKLAKSQGTEVSFSDILKDTLESVKEQEAVDQENNKVLASGELDNLHNIMIDAVKTDIMLQFTMQIRNKVIDAYQEIMRIQL